MRVFLCLMTLLFAVPAFADDWQVNRVRGEVTQKVGSNWQSVQRGDIIPNDRYLKTGEDGRVGLVRSNETIELEGNTQIRIQDAGPDRMTSVLQDFGVVAIEAERRNVMHFSVQTPFLAAVVKGTRFTVRSDRSSASVSVDRGLVQVQDTRNDLVADVRPGQAATVSSQAPLLVEGGGPIAVYTFEGAPVVNGTTEAIEASANSRADAASRVNNAGGDGRGNAYGLTRDTDAPGKSGSSNAGGNGKANSGKNNAGGNGNGNAYGLSGDRDGPGNSGSSNAGGNGNSGSSNAGGNGNSGDSNAGGNGNGNAYGQSSDSAGPGNSGSSNAGGNGNGRPTG